MKNKTSLPIYMLILSLLVGCTTTSTASDVTTENQPIILNSTGLANVAEATIVDTAEDITQDSIMQIGITNGNSNNGGRVAYNSNYVFFSDFHGIYRIEKATNNIRKISDDFGRSLNVLEDGIIYLSNDGIYRMYFDGSNAIKLSDFLSWQAIVYDGYIYAVEAPTGSIVRISLITAEVEFLNNQNS